MNITNIMNFVRSFEPRNSEIEKKLLDTAKGELDLCNEMNLPATFLLEYDVLHNEDFVRLFKENAGENIELGLWYEIVEPLTSDIGIPYDSPRGYKWDWNIHPGFSISYPNDIKEKLIDQAMKKFRNVFGYYPRTVASWVLDTYTVNYITEKYDIDALAICRDQISTDAYTLIGGYFNGLYYPSKNNIFTPASNIINQNNTPVIRLLGPDPIHNYDSSKYLSKKDSGIGVYSLEPACTAGRDPLVVDWFFKNYYNPNNIGLCYTQIGQENSFAMFDLVTPLRMQFNKLLHLGVKFMKMCDTGTLFKQKYKQTPPSSVIALDNWDTEDCQTVYYSCKNYVANVFRHRNIVAIRALYLFDDRIRDTYLDKICDTFDSIHENMPIVDTFPQRGDTDGGSGIILNTGATDLSVKKKNEQELTVEFGESAVTFTEDEILLENCDFSFTPYMSNTEISHTDTSIQYRYKANTYSLAIKGGKVEKDLDTYKVNSKKIILKPLSN